MRQIKEPGFLYDSSLIASDDPYEILLNKQPTEVVEIPVEWIRDDYPYFGATANGSLPSAELALQTFQSEFDVAYEEAGLFVLTMHPHLIVMLSRLITHITAMKVFGLQRTSRLQTMLKPTPPRHP
jgi:peptidoglycan-N-acetylglucosamine deacetylase